VVVAPRVKLGTSALLVDHQLRADVPNEVDQDILLKSVTNPLIVGVQDVVPIFSTNEEPLAVSGCLVQELGPHLKCDAVTTNDALVSILYWVDFILVDLESDLDIALLNKVYFSELV
jgi:hypothetical protein